MADEAGAPQAAKVRTPSRSRRPPEWLWLGSAVEQAEGEISALAEREQQAFGKARAASELARRALEPVEPLAADAGKWLALVLYREALAWALRAEGVQGGSLAELFGRAPSELLVFAAGDERSLARLRTLAVEKPVENIAGEAVETQEAEARVLRSATEALLYRRAAPERLLARLLVRRWLRVGGLVVFVVALFVAALLAADALALGPDLAKGKPWRASSREHACHPEERRCGDEKTRAFFYTRREIEPWLEIDLKKAETVSVVEVKNRDRCCPDRALPLVVELSKDREDWHEVERRTETFYTWRARFEPELARYVRLRVPRETTLHLVRVSVYSG